MTPHETFESLIQIEAGELERTWEAPRWHGIKRDYSAEDVIRLRGSLKIEYTLAHRGAEKLWRRMQKHPYVSSLGALTGNQAVQQVKAGLKAIYLSGWQVAGDANLGETTYPDQSLYPANSVPAVVRRINNALRRADQIHWSEGNNSFDWYAPIVADAEAGFGGALNAYELMRSMIEAGAAGVHFEDQLASEKKCGHLGGKVLVPTAQFVRTLTAARLAADVCGVPTVLIARTDALSAKLLTSDVDERDRDFLTLNAAMFELAHGYAEGGMTAYVHLQEREFELEEQGYTATRHQREVGAGYFDQVAQVISGGESSTLALKGSTEEAQFASNP